MRFEAAVLRTVGAPLSVEEVELGPLQPGDVRVRLRASGLCHTDLEAIRGDLAYPLPIVLGHEGAGVVDAVGSAVQRVRPGDHVVLSWNPHCGHCFHCERDEPILCEPFTRHQPAGRLPDGGTRLSRGGETIHHYFTTSTHAQYTVVPESGAIPVPHEIPFDRACLIGCGVMTGVGGVVRKARLAPGESLAVLGCGPVGLNAIQGGRLAGAEPLIAVDRDAGRLEWARRFGATALVLADGADTAQKVRELTGGRGADCVVEAAGSGAAFGLSAELVRSGGQLVWLGKVAVNETVAFRWGALMGEKRIVRSSYGGARPQRDFPWLARAYLDGRLQLDELITARLPLARINEGFAAMARGEGIRSVVLFPD